MKIATWNVNSIKVRLDAAIAWLKETKPDVVALQEIKQIIRKSRMLEYFESREDITQIGGLDILKEWLLKRGKAFSPKAREFGLPQPRAIDRVALARQRLRELEADAG